jgi:hypothetical protein
MEIITILAVSVKTRKPSPSRAAKALSLQPDDYKNDDASMITLLEHVNINVPEHKYAVPFYFDILGCGMDPRRAQNVNKGSGTVW